MICPILMKDAADVERVNRVAVESGIEMSVKCEHFMIDPKSILGLFAIVGKDAELVLPDDLNERTVKRLVKRMSVSA